MSADNYHSFGYVFHIAAAIPYWSQPKIMETERLSIEMDWNAYNTYWYDCIFGRNLHQMFHIIYCEIIISYNKRYDKISINLIIKQNTFFKKVNYCLLRLDEKFLILTYKYIHIKGTIDICTVAHFLTNSLNQKWWAPFWKIAQKESLLILQQFFKK